MNDPTRREGAMHSPVPIVPGARFTVYCECGFGSDSAAITKSGAIADVAPRHGCPESKLTATAVDYHDHPLYEGKYHLTHPRVNPKGGAA